MSKFVDEIGLKKILEALKAFIGEPQEDDDRIWLYDNFSVNVEGPSPDIQNTIIKVVVDDETIYEQNWSGYIPAFRVKPGSSVVVSASDIDGYKSVAPYWFITQENAVRVLNFKFIHE